ncbi:MAG: arsenate reductase (glutaredoxin) [Crocinitomicaceae bacterium]
MKDLIQIWHNARCSKSRNAFKWLAENKREAEWVDYMKNPISESDVKKVLEKLKMSAFDLVRKKEQLFLEKYSNQSFSEAEWIRILTENPQLIERPIVLKGDKAVIARPLENIEQLF